MSCNSFTINDLIAHFLRCAPINALDILIPKESICCFLNSETQHKILNSTVNSDVIKRYPVKQSYQQTFLKWLMNKVEENGGEICDSIYIAYCNLISYVSNASIHYRHYLVENDCISVRESTNIISEGTTGLCSWQGAIELSNWCMENKNKFCDKVILELGCGVGLTGLCIIKKCSPEQYIFTDCHKSVLDVVSENLKLNLLSNEMEIQENLEYHRLKFHIKYKNRDVQVIELRWEEINMYINEQKIVPDIIIGADIIYDTTSFHALVFGLKIFLSFKNRFAIIATAVRNLDTVSQFLYDLERHDLAFEDCSLPQEPLPTKLAHLTVKILKIILKDEEKS